jgi:hypothetical protein
MHETNIRIHKNILVLSKNVYILLYNAEVVIAHKLFISGRKCKDVTNLESAPGSAVTYIYFSVHLIMLFQLQELRSLLLDDMGKLSSMLTWLEFENVRSQPTLKTITSISCRN